MSPEFSKKEALINPENSENKEKNDALQKQNEMLKKQESATRGYFEQTAKEPAGKMENFISMRDFATRIIDDSESSQLQGNPNYEKSGDKDTIDDIYTKVHHEFEMELRQVHQEDLTPEEYSKRMMEALGKLEKWLEDAKTTVNGLLNGTLAEKSKKDAKALEKSEKSEPSFKDRLQKFLNEEGAKKRKQTAEAQAGVESKEKQAAGETLTADMQVAFPGRDNNQKVV